MIRQQEHTFKLDGETVVAIKKLPARQPIARAMLLHGAGQAQTARYMAVIDDLVTAGVEVVAFDFSGHGKSTGKLSELSLKRREHQAKTILEWADHDELPLVLIGFSMSGQTICDLIAHEHINPTTIALCCPAVYTADVHHLLFGDPSFTNGLRTPGSWKTSASFEVLTNYKGQIILAFPENDEVIPKEISKAIEQACPKERTQTIIAKGSKHQLGIWFGDHPKERNTFIDVILQTL